MPPHGTDSLKEDAQAPVKIMNIPRRRFLRLGAGAAALPIISQVARAENQPTQPSFEARERPLAQRLAAYAHGLRYEDLDAATIERVKTHVIDTIGCGLCAWDERPVRICREIALSANGPATINWNASASNN